MATSKLTQTVSEFVIEIRLVSTADIRCDVFDIGLVIY